METKHERKVNYLMEQKKLQYFGLPEQGSIVVLKRLPAERFFIVSILEIKDGYEMTLKSVENEDVLETVTHRGEILKTLPA